jgi:hypothetical protein
MLNLNEDIKTRTFGIEIEMCNLDRNKVVLPKGYEWSKDEEIVNTDGSSNKRFGGEVNTPPLHICNIGNLHELRNVYEQMKEAGGVIKWTTYTHVHIYAGDLSVEQLRRVWMFFYVCYPYIKKYASISESDELAFNLMPVPTEEYFEKVKNAQSVESLIDVFTNQSKKGFIRHAINISAVNKTKTIEFRTYHGTDNFYLALNCVLASFRIFYFAINNEVEEYYKINTYSEFIDKVKLRYILPSEKIPLIYQGNPYSAIETFQTKSLSYCSSYASALKQALDAHKKEEICIVNGFMYFYELYFFEKLKKITIYAQDPYCYLLYLIANGKKVKYTGKIEWIEQYNNESPKRQLAIALYLSKLQKFLMSSSVRNNAVIEALKEKALESIEKTEKSCDRLYRLLTTCEFNIGTLQDVIQKHSVIFFNYGRNKIQKRVFKLISENSDLEIEFNLKRNEYYELIETLPKETYFYYLSKSPYLKNMHKQIMFNSSSGERRNAGTFLYCNQPIEIAKSNTYYESEVVQLNEIVPINELVIDDAEKLKILKVNSEYLYRLQKKYIKKVDMCSHCTFAFVVMYDKYTLGGFGFTLPKHNGYDLFQLTDFCTNNNIPRLSKLILYCIQTKAVQKILSRKMHKMVENVISLAYTHKPVSMKYRGVYEKIQELSTKSYLAYEGKLGKYDTTKQVIEKYKKNLSNGK